MQSVALNETIADRYLSRVRLQVLGETPSARFRRTYRDDRLAFIHDCVEFPNGGGLTRYQEEAVAALEEHFRVAIRSPRGGGKSGLASLLVHHYILTREKDETKVPTTASSWQQLNNYLWPEIHKWVPQIRWHMTGRDPYTRDQLLDQSIKLSNTCRAFSMASDKPANMEGGHGECIFVRFDESKTIPNPTWDALEGTFSRPGERYFLAVSTPGPPSGRFYDIHKRKPGFEDWYPIHWTMEELIEAGMMDPVWAEQRLKQWGENSALYQRDVLGNFAADEEDVLIPLTWVEAAVDRWHEWKKKGGKIPDGVPLRVGIDTAAGGGDLTSIVPRYDDLIPEVIYMNVKNTMRIVDRVANVMDQAMGGETSRDVRGYVEVIGHGGKGVYDRLVEREYLMEAVNVSATSDIKDASGLHGFVNVRSQLWWAMREWLDPDLGSTAKIPPDARLIGDLTSPTFEPTSTGKLKVEPKEKTKKRLGRSPDGGDGSCMTQANPYPRVQIFV